MPSAESFYTLGFGSAKRFVERVHHVRKTSQLPKLAPCAMPALASPDITALEAAKIRRHRQTAEHPFYRVPLMPVQASRQYIFDEQNKRYLDLFGGNGQLLLGHSHPRVTEAVHHQMQRISCLTHHFLRESETLLTEELLALFPTSLDAVCFLSTEVETVEFAALLTRLATQNHEFWAFRGSYFGFTHLANSLSGLSYMKYPVPQATGIHHFGVPDFYRSGLEKNQLTDHCLRDAVSSLRASSSGTLAGCIIETIQGPEAGVISVDLEYIRHLCTAVRKRNGLIIAQESWTALGRTGKHIWGFESWGSLCVPDIVLISRGLGNGLPVTAVVTRSSLLAHMRQRVFSSSFAGNVVGAAAARAVLRALKEESLQENASYVGAYLLAQLRALQRQYSSTIGAIRSHGLLAGIELVKDPITREPALQITTEVHEMLKNRGILVGKGGVYGNVLSITPPLCLVNEDIDFFMFHLEEALRTVLDAAEDDPDHSSALELHSNTYQSFQSPSDGSDEASDNDDVTHSDDDNANNDSEPLSPPPPSFDATRWRSIR